MLFPGSDGQAASVDDIRRVAFLARLSKRDLPKERRPANSIMSTMIALPPERRPAATIMGSMKV